MELRPLGAADAPPPAVHPSPEAEACRRAYQALMAKLVELAALSGNLARLYAEYRKTVRRVRALQDVLLPEMERTLAEIETRLEELEQDGYGFLRLRLRLRLCLRLQLVCAACVYACGFCVAAAVAAVSSPRAHRSPMACVLRGSMG